MNLHPVTMPTRQQYDAAFAAECARSYPEIREYEIETGCAIDRERLESAARILACPVKASPPNWQHGRILYATARRYLVTSDSPVRIVDIGTAKGFSALMLLWALNDSGKEGRVESVDVIDPNAKVFRNSVLDVDGDRRLSDYHRDWPEAEAITFRKSTGVDWLSLTKERVHLAFVDGKHSADVVEIGRASCRERGPSKCRSRWSPYH